MNALLRSMAELIRVVDEHAVSGDTPLTLEARNVLEVARANLYQATKSREMLVQELVFADKILKAMLNAMPLAKKQELAAKLDAEGISPDGMIRTHERAAALAAAGVPL